MTRERCKCDAGEGVAHRDGCDGTIQTVRTGLRVRLSSGPPIDLDSMEIVSERASSTGHVLRMATGRLKRAAEDRELAQRRHTIAMRDWEAARSAYEIAQGQWTHVSRGGLLDEVKAQALPELCQAHETPITIDGIALCGSPRCLRDAREKHDARERERLAHDEPVAMPIPGDGQ